MTLTTSNLTEYYLTISLSHYLTIRTMLIAIDAHMVGERETGNETYTLSLISGAAAHQRAIPRAFRGTLAGPPNATQTLPSTTRSQQRRFGDGPRFHLLATHPERLRSALLGPSSDAQQTLPPHASIERVRPGNALLRIPLTMPIQALRKGYDLLHVTYNAPPLCPCPTVVTIHDISFEHYPQFFSPRDRLILKTLVPLSARHARRIITVSEHAKREIMACYDIPADKITVTYEAASEQFRPITDPVALQVVRAKYGIPDGPFILALGNLQPRKNIRRLVEAFARVVNSQQSTVKNGQSFQNADHCSLSTVHCSLIIAGKAQWRESEIFQAVRGRDIENGVIFPGYVDDADLPALYSAATVFVYPSLYEGFGLPPLEAMACGTPVISSNAASLPEVVGDAAFTVNPTDTDGLARALLAVLATPTLQENLRQSGLQRAAQFSWDRCAAMTLAVYLQTVLEK